MSFDARALLLAGALLALGGCAKPIDIVLPADRPLELLIYTNGIPSQKCEIAVYSPQFKQLQSLLNAKPRDWTPALSMVSPSASVLVVGNGINVDFLRDLVVVSFQQGQFQRSIASSEYAFLQCPRELRSGMVAVATKEFPVPLM